MRTEFNKSSPDVSFGFAHFQKLQSSNL